MQHNGKHNQILLRYIYKGNNVLVILDTNTAKMTSIVTIKKESIKKLSQTTRH